MPIDEFDACVLFTASARFQSRLGLLCEQSQAPEARVTFTANHQVIVDGDAQRLGRGLDLAGHLDVVA